MRDEANAYAEQHPHSAGNGALMRTAPVALAHLDDRGGLADAVAPRIPHRVAEQHAAPHVRRGALEQLGEARAVEDVVAEHERHIIVAHEVAHLAHMDHSPRFWAAVEALKPGYGTCRAWLRRHGGDLLIWRFDSV